MIVRFNQNEKAFTEQFRNTFVTFLMELPNLIISLVVAVSTTNLVIWADTLASFSRTLHCLLVTLLTLKLRRSDIYDKYNYGTHKLETFFSIVCDTLVAICSIAIITGSIGQLNAPEEITGNIVFFAGLKIINTATDMFFLIREKNLLKTNKSRIIETEYQAELYETLHDASVLVVCIICYFLRGYAFSRYISPIVAIIISVAFFKRLVMHMKTVFNELVDVSLSIPEQDEIHDLLLKRTEYFKKINTVYFRRIGDTVYIEIDAAFKDEITYSEQISLLKELTQMFTEKIESVNVDFIIKQ